MLETLTRSWQFLLVIVERFVEVRECWNYLAKHALCCSLCCSSAFFSACNEPKLKKNLLPDFKNLPVIGTEEVRRKINTFIWPFVVELIQFDSCTKLDASFNHGED